MRLPSRKTLVVSACMALVSMLTILLAFADPLTVQWWVGLYGILCTTFFLGMKAMERHEDVNVEDPGTGSQGVGGRPA